MVKNTSGGTKTKGLARKHQGGGGGGGHLRIPEDELEKVAYVAKMLGNGMCQVYINDNPNPLIAHIRKKFSGRHKRSNLIATGTCVLIGLRDWENPVKNCDIIVVYDQHEISSILNIPSIPSNVITKLFNQDKDKFNTKHQDQDKLLHQHLHEHDDLFNDDDHDHDTTHTNNTNNTNTLLDTQLDTQLDTLLEQDLQDI